MKPRTRIQKEIAQLSKTLPRLSKAQRAYAFEHCFKHYAHRTKKGVITCLECGHQWKSSHHLAESICGCTCPHCGKQLEMLDTRKRVFREWDYLCIITICKQYQVIRYFQINMYRKVGQMAEYSATEVFQRWIAPNGKTETIARLRCYSLFYYDIWNVNDLVLLADSDDTEVVPFSEHSLSGIQHFQLLATMRASTTANTLRQMVLALPLVSTLQTSDDTFLRSVGIVLETMLKCVCSLCL